MPFILIMIAPSNFASETIAKGGLVPGSNNGLYYKIGGGDVTPLPVAKDNDAIHLKVGGNSGFGYNCGVFNPQSSIENSLNQVEGSLGAMTTNIVNSSTAMLMSMPAYLLARNMPETYKMLQDGLMSGQMDFNVASKNCDSMKSDIDRGENPYNDWMQASLGDSWKKSMSIAELDVLQDGLLGAANDYPEDVNQVGQEINKSNGKDGVNWVQGVSKDGGKYAGGDGQTTILLTRDTVIAGYNVLLGSDRQYDDISVPNESVENNRLLSAFESPEDVANWVANVVGEQEITTYSGGTKNSIPGVGLLGDIQKEADTISEKLSAMVVGNDPINVENLQAVSPPKIMLNAEVIEMIKREDDDLMRAIYVNKISQEIASARVIDKAKLGLQCLDVGSQVPAIYSNHAAQAGITALKERMRIWINDLRENPKDNEIFVGKTLTTLMRASKEKQLSALMTRPTSKTPGLLQDGAVMKENDQ